MQTRLGQYVETVKDPRDTAIEEIDKVVENIQTGILFEEAVKVVVGENQRVRSWLLGGSNKKLNSTHNWRFRELRDRYMQHVKQPGNKVLIVKMSPFIVIWQTTKTATTNVVNEVNEVNEVDKSCDNFESQSKNGDGDSINRTNDDLFLKNTKPESTSFASFTSFTKSKSKIEYEYLRETNSYRCPKCRCIYLIDTKDSPKSHPCNNQKLDEEEMAN